MCWNYDCWFDVFLSASTSSFFYLNTMSTLYSSMDELEREKKNKNQEWLVKWYTYNNNNDTKEKETKIDAEKKNHIKSK